MEAYDQEKDQGKNEDRGGHRPEGVFVGLATLDVIYRVNKLPQAGEKIDSLAMTSAAGGPAANAAVAFSNAGGDATLVTKLSDDTIGAVIRDDLESLGVKVISYGGSTTDPAVVSTVMIDPSGEHAIVSSGDTEAIEASSAASKLVSGVDKENGERFIDAAYNWFSDKPVVTMVDGYHADLASLASWAAEHLGHSLILDSNIERARTAAQLLAADVPVVSRAFCGDRSLHETIQYLQERGCERGVITNGADAITFWHPERDQGNGQSTVGQIMPEHVAEAVVDTLGAGDFFHGAFAYAEATRPSGLNRDAFVSNIRFASKAAAESVRSFGTRDWLLGRI